MCESAVYTVRMTALLLFDYHQSVAAEDTPNAGSQISGVDGWMTVRLDATAEQTRASVEINGVSELGACDSSVQVRNDEPSRLKQ